MKKLIATLLVGGLAALVVVGCGPTPTSESTAPKAGGTGPGTGAAAPVKGKITKAEGGKITVEGKDYTIPDTATVKIDDKTSKASDIKEGGTATITEKDGKVTEVVVTTK